ncbi:MAG: lysophospholipid acyltransferase family protein [Pseudomonadota bacterium]|nr:lysophospholipid acyltransferase family protein [Pseudomonadota bacterium]
MRRVFGLLFAVIGSLVTIVFAFLVSFPILPFAVLPRGRRERYAIRGAQLFAWLILRPLLWLRIDGVGLEKLPRQGGYLVISNHRSWIDVPILMLFTASNGISKKEVKYVPFFGLNGYLSGAIFFDRKRKMDRARVVSEALLLLRGGGNVHVFPEGTRTRDGRIGSRIYLRLVQSCWENGVDVVPACIWGTEHVVPASAVYAMPGQSVGIEVEAPLDRATFTDGEAYAAASWAKVVEIARRRGCDHPFAEAASA